MNPGVPPEIVGAGGRPGAGGAAVGGAGIAGAAMAGAAAGGAVVKSAVIASGGGAAKKSLRGADAVGKVPYCAGAGPGEGGGSCEKSLVEPTGVGGSSPRCTGMAPAVPGAPNGGAVGSVSGSS